MLGCQSGVVVIVYYNCCSECSNEYSESVILTLQLSLRTHTYTLFPSHAQQGNVVTHVPVMTGSPEIHSTFFFSEFFPFCNKWWYEGQKDGCAALAHRYARAHGDRFQVQHPAAAPHAVGRQLGASKRVHSRAAANTRPWPLQGDVHTAAWGPGRRRPSEHTDRH